MNNQVSGYENCLKYGTKVTVHSLGENTPGEFKGFIRGVSSKDCYPDFVMYIVEMYERFRGTEDYPYSCVVIPSSCIREGWPEK